MMKPTELRTKGGTPVRYRWVEGSAYFGGSAFDLHVWENGRRAPLILGFIKPASVGHGWEGRRAHTTSAEWQWFSMFDEATMAIAQQALEHRYGKDNLP